MGMNRSINKMITDADIVGFTDISLEVNPLHFDEDLRKENDLRRPSRPWHANRLSVLGRHQWAIARARHRLPGQFIEIHRAGTLG